MNGFIYNSSGVAKLVRIHKGTTMLAGARFEVDYWHRQSEWNNGPKELSITRGERTQSCIKSFKLVYCPLDEMDCAPNKTAVNTLRPRRRD
jgi:hypothetical protein